MPLGGYDPIVPSPGDCIVCVEGPKGKMVFYFDKEGSVPTIIARGKELYLAAVGEMADRIAAYYVDNIQAKHLFGVDV
jgi:hypothetical protein